MSRPTTDIDYAWSLLESGRAVVAEPLLLRCCEISPAESRAWFLLGVARHLLGKFPEALEAFSRAVDAGPSNVQAHSARANMLSVLGRQAEALDGYRQALALSPADPQLLTNAGVVLEHLQRQAEALEHYDAALSHDSRFADALLNRGVVLTQLGRMEEALANNDRLAGAHPGMAAAHLNRAEVLLALKRFAPALAAADEALKLDPRNLGAAFDRAVALTALGRLEEALAGFDAVLDLEPRHAGALLRRGVVLLALGRSGEARANDHRLAEISPDVAEVHSTQAEVLFALGHFPAALETSERTLALSPGHPRAAMQRAFALAALGRLAESRAGLEAARGLDPQGFADVYGPGSPDPRPIYLNAGWERLLRCDWGDRERYLNTMERFIREAASQGSPISERSLVYHGLALPLSHELPALLARTVSAGVQASVQGEAELPFLHTNFDAGWLRIGYISPDFREHPNGQLTRRLYALHDRTQFEIYGYSLQPDDGSRYRRDIEKGCDVFRDLQHLDAAEAARQIRADGIQILVDLAGYTTFSRTEILAMQPAPIQVSYLGMPGTMGAEFMQYRLTDAVATPVGVEDRWGEKLVYLPGTFFIYDDQQLINEMPPARGQLGLPPEGFVFCAFHNAYKIEPVVFGVWMDLLRRLPRSVLWLNVGGRQAAPNLRREAAARGVAPQRLVFAERLPRKKEHLARYSLANLFLDTFDFNAMTTACDALWAGLPVLTCAGERPPSRVAASLLTALGLPDLITDTAESYAEQAFTLAAHPEKLESVRARLARNRLSHPLFDTARTVRHLEQAYRMMWERHMAGQPPASFHVPQAGP